MIVMVILKFRQNLVDKKVVKSFKPRKGYLYLPCSVAYSKWVPFLRSEDFDRNAMLPGMNISYTDAMFMETVIVNTLAVALIALIIVMPILVLHPKFRNRSQRVITVTHDRFGWSKKAVDFIGPFVYTSTKSPKKL